MGSRSLREESSLYPANKEYRLPKVILTHSEIEAIMNVPDINDPMGIRDRAILEVLYSTGVRRAELCGLNKADIDFDRGLVRVEQGKGHKDRFVPIGERALKWLEKYLVEIRPQLTVSAGVVALFLNTLGERISPTRWDISFIEPLKSLGSERKEVATFFVMHSLLLC